MKRHSSAVSVALAVLTVLAVLGLAGPVAAGEQVPFKGRYEGSFTRTPIPGTPNAHVVTVGTGEATQLGHFSFDFQGTVKPALPTETSYTFTAANGDKVFAAGIARNTLLPNGLHHVEETATITGGTGRFAGATGSFIGERLRDIVTGEVIGFFDGTISSPGSGN